MAPATLLLVDDDDFVRLSLARALDRSGAFSVVPAEHGRRALELLSEQRVDAVLTDLQMPVMDGLTLLGNLLERGLHLPVAVMTGHSITPELQDQLQRYGIAATFTKPVELSFLVDELQRRLHPATVGRITGVTLFGFLQLLEVERKTGLIIVHAGEHEGRLYFNEGQLIHAEARRLRGADALPEILSWPDPRLEIFYKRASRERTIKEPLQHLLMEAARLMDERARSGTTGAPALGAAGGRTAPDSSRDGAGVQASLEQAMHIDGVLGVALVDAASGVSLGSAGGSPLLDLELAGAAAADIVRVKVRVLAGLGVKDAIEDVIITLGKQYHLIRFLTSDENLFLYLVLDRDRASLGLARHRLAAIAREMIV